MIDDDWQWLTMTDDNPQWSTMINDDCWWSIIIDDERQGLMMINDDQSMMINDDQWPIMITKLQEKNLQSSTTRKHSRMGPLFSILIERLQNKKVCSKTAFNLHFGLWKAPKPDII